MELDTTFFLFAVPAVLFAAISRSGFAPGAAFAASPFLALVLDPAHAVGVMLPLLMFMDLIALRPYWRRWSWPDARLLMFGAMPGIGAGAFLFGRAGADTIRLSIGIIALGFVAFTLARRARYLVQRKPRGGPLPALLWGALAGFTSFVSHAGGPPAFMYLLGRRLDKTTFQATAVIVFWWVNLVKFGPYVALGMFTRETLVANIWLAPVAAAGVFVGVRAHGVLSQGTYFGLTYTFLTLTGAKLIWDGLT
ncbi:MAG: sulfite exporter TauE/SafE family protein [Paracoccaceae bacterium]